MARLRYSRAAVSGTDDAALWRALGTVGSRLAPGRPPGFAAAVKNHWLCLSADRACSPADRIERLTGFLVDLGAPAREVTAAVGRERDRLARSTPVEWERRERASASRRARLETNWKGIAHD